jgi:hypothetical protein
VTYAAQVQPTPLNNRTQIFQDTVSVSNTAEAVKKYGRSSEIARLKMKKMIELRRDIEAAALGNGASVTASGSTAGQLRGLYGFIATNASVGATGTAPNPTTNTAPVAGTARAITDALVKAAVLGAYTNGGDASMCLVSPTQKQNISALTGNVTRQQQVPSSKADGQLVLNTAFTFYGHDFGVTKIVPNRVQAVVAGGLSKAAYIVDADKIALGQLRPFESEQMATVGDAKNWQIRTEVTLVVRDEKPLASILDLQ